MKLIVDELSFHYSSTLRNNSPDNIGATNGRKQYAPMEDITLLSEQIGACNALLTNMCYHNGNIHGSEFSEIAVDALWKEACSDIATPDLPTLLISSSECTIVAPRVPLVRALKGVVMNAVQAVSEKTKTDSSRGKVHIYTEVDDSNITFGISDNGPGMDAGVRSMCHQPFFTTKNNATSLGLGLFVANTVAVQLGGTLTIDSTKGKGTRVSFTVPRTIQCKNTC
jgi:two-component system sensor histidine kinase RegB